MSQEHYTRIADLYDAFVKTDADVSFFTQQARKHGGEILELMAGTGRLTMPMLEAGFTVTALDFSPEMLNLLHNKLKTRGLTAEVHQADIRTFEIGKTFDQIWIPFQAFPELVTEADQRQALQRIHAHLADDGIFICTLHNPPVRVKSVDGQMRLVGNHILETGDRLMVWLLQTHDPQSNIVEVHEFFEKYDAQGTMKAKRYSVLHFQLLEKAVFERLLAEAGFEVTALYGNYVYGAFDESSSPFMIWVARKR